MSSDPKRADRHDVRETSFNGHDSDFAALDPDSGVKRGLKTRHISMMAIAGIIGPGLLVGSGGALSSGGPASLLLGFGIIGIIAFSIMQSLGELTTLYPTSGAFVSLADRFVDKAFGVATGWNYWLIWAAVLANEYNVICSVMVYWGERLSGNTFGLDRTLKTDRRRSTSSTVRLLSHLLVRLSRIPVARS
jgi:amino acid transporter